MILISILMISFFICCLYISCKVAKQPIKLEEERILNEKLRGELSSVCDRITDFIININDLKKSKNLDNKFRRIFEEGFNETMPLKDYDGIIYRYRNKNVKKFTERLIVEFPEVFKERNREKKIDSLLSN